MDKTVVVAIEWRQPHPVYKKSVRKTTKLHAHDADNKCQIGDIVNLMETRPLSKTKRWRVTEIVNTQEIRALSPEQVEGLEDKDQQDDESEPTNNTEEEPQTPDEEQGISGDEENTSVEEEEIN
tara:strand:- start:217 stop:588 length:372 start_codon:yes stop_codon:yes gene_type:complete